MSKASKLLVALGNEIKTNSLRYDKKGDVGRMYLSYLNKKYKFDEWLYLSNINSYVCEKDGIILIKPITSIIQNNGILIKHILSYFNCRDIKNTCIILPDIYRPVGKYKYKEFAKIHEKLSSDFYNLLNTNLMNNLNKNNYLQLCFGTNSLQHEKVSSVKDNFEEVITEHEHKIFLNTFKLADEYFKKKILNSNYVCTNLIHLKKKYPAMEPQKRVKKSTATRRYILDIYKHMYK
ncbi:conserved protein, unknown function [Hepatocystis sp. ex Piliocolobus tephrosceles]|nr:conserved protein, unknown function [Hepatocystis sp. ex Piliocolobus tephrosceles]